MSTKEFIQELVVEVSMTAAQIGSGLLPVFSTPSMIAFMENTAMQMINLSEGESSVGTMINAKHLKASKIGEKLYCSALISEQEGRRFVFELKVIDSKGDTVGVATHERFVILVEKFMSRL